MTDQISTLLIRIDGSAAKSQVDAAKTSLDGLTTSGNAASTSASGLNKELGKAPAVARAATVETAAATEAMGAFAGMTTRAKTELIVLAHELSQGQTRRFGGSLMVLAEQTGAASVIMSAMGAAVLGTTAAVGAFAYAIYKGREAVQQFNNTALLTNGYLGLTRSGFDSLAEKLDSSGLRFGKSRDMLSALAETGQFTASNIESVGQAALRMGELSKAGTDEVVADFVKLAQDPLHAAAQLNEQMHFLTLAQYEHVKALQESGDKAAALKVVTDALNESLGSNAQKTTDDSHGLIAWASGWAIVEEEIKSTTSMLKEFWDWQKKVSEEAPETISRLEQMFGRAASLFSGSPSAAFSIAFNDPQAARNAADAAARQKSQADILEGQKIEAAPELEALARGYKAKTAALKEQAVAFSLGAEAMQKYRIQQDLLEAAKDTNPVRRQGRIDIINAAAPGLLDAARQQDANRAAQEYAKQQKADRESELHDLMQREEEERKSVRAAQTRSAELDYQLTTGEKLNEAQKKLVDLQAEAQPLTSNTLTQELEINAAKEKQLAAQEKINAAKLRAVEQDQHSALRQADRLDRPDSTQSLQQSIYDNPFDVKALTKQALADENKYYKEQRALHVSSKEFLLAQNRDYYGELDKLEQEHQRKVFAITKQETKDKEAAVEATLHVASDGFGALADLQDKSSREGFERYKKFAIAQAIISTIESAIKAAEAVYNVPYVGPVLAVAAAAAAAAAGYARVQQIQSQQYTGRALGGSVDAGGMYQVGEGGRPELLEDAGKYYLIPGDGGGRVIPSTPSRAANDSAPQNVTLIVNGTNGPTNASSERTNDGINIRLAVNAASLALQKDIATGGPTSKLMQQSFALQRAGR